MSHHWGGDPESCIQAQQAAEPNHCAETKWIPSAHLSHNIQLVPTLHNITAVPASPPAHTHQLDKISSGFFLAQKGPCSSWGPNPRKVEFNSSPSTTKKKKKLPKIKGWVFFLATITPPFPNDSPKNILTLSYFSLDSDGLNKSWANSSALSTQNRKGKKRPNWKINHLQNLTSNPCLCLIILRIN
jgi:hypothetical protein